MCLVTRSNQTSAFNGSATVMVGTSSVDVRNISFAEGCKPRLSPSTVTKLRDWRSETAMPRSRPSKPKKRASLSAEMDFTTRRVLRMNSSTMGSRRSFVLSAAITN
ncbi:hypothetical protein CJO83_17670 (plasmid) [Ralstonia solanacearum]|nr:hypothetical protein CJO83_17670 [Ralstonia solanacearum]